MASPKDGDVEQNVSLTAGEKPAGSNGDAAVPSPEQKSTPKGPPQQGPPPVQVEGRRRIILLIAIFIGLFLSFLDTTIVAVALTTIADEFNDYNHSAWVMTAYLLTYMAFGIILARLSDIFGRKAVEVASFVLFIAFSLGCALSKSMTQLIIFRAFQGVGGSGLYSMTMVIAIPIVPPQKRGFMSAAIGMVLVTAGVLGPILSGAIAHANWRWIFYLNLPVGGIALSLLLLAWPKQKTPSSITFAALKGVDFLGCILLLAAAVLLIFALQEAGAYVFSWNSPAIIACLTLSGVAFIAFALWQEWLAKHPNFPIKMVFPMFILRKRVIGSAILLTMLSGFVYYIAIVNLPQRFRIVDRQSPVIAGVKLLPMMVSAALGSFLGGAVNRKKNYTGPTLITASAFQVLGYGLMITLRDKIPTPNSQFGFQVFLGLGFGLVMSTVTMLVQLQSEPRWIAVTQGALTQMRSLGGSLGLAIGVIVLNNQIRVSADLSAILTPDQMSALLKSPLTVETLSPTEQALVSKAYASAFTQEMQVATYIAAACFVVSLFTIQRHPPQLRTPPAPPPKSVETNGERKAESSER